MTINARYLIPKFYTKTRQGIFLFCLSVHLPLVALVQKQNVHHSIVWKYVFLFTYSMKTKILSKQKLIRSKKNHSILIAKISSRKTQKSLIRKNKLDRKNLCHTVSIAYRPHGKSLPNILQSLSIQHADFPSVYPVPGLSDSKPGENKMRVIWEKGLVADKWQARKAPSLPSPLTCFESVCTIRHILKQMTLSANT